MFGDAPVLSAGASGGAPPGSYPASAIGFNGWTVSTSEVTANFALGSGTLFLARMYFARATIVTHLTCSVVIAGSTPGAYSGLALYDDAGNLLSSTPDMGAQFAASTGNVTGTLTVAQSSGSFAWAGTLWQGGTGPKLCAAQVDEVGGNAGTRRTVFLGGQTAFPATVNYGTATLNNGIFWVATS